MTHKERVDILTRINTYADDVLKDIDPQKTKISFQLEKLKPIMEKIASEYQSTVEEIFILYMDMASEATSEQEAAYQNNINL